MLRNSDGNVQSRVKIIHQIIPFIAGRDYEKKKKKKRPDDKMNVN